MCGAMQSRAKSPTVTTVFVSVSFLSGVVPGFGSSHCHPHSSVASHFGTDCLSYSLAVSLARSAFFPW